MYLFKIYIPIYIIGDVTLYFTYLQSMYLVLDKWKHEYFKKYWDKDLDGCTLIKLRLYLSTSTLTRHTYFHFY